MTELLQQENEALRKELKELIHLTITVDMFLQDILYDLKKWNIDSDAKYLDELLETIEAKLAKLKYITDDEINQERNL